MTDEILAGLDEQGKPLLGGVPRSEAHRRGVWHRTVSIFVLNQHGEILLEKRSLNKDLFPGFYDIPGGHVKHGQTPLKTALEELREELGLSLAPERITPLCEEDALIERVVLPERGIINLERKTAYLVEVNEFEEAVIVFKAGENAQLSRQELESKREFGEVSCIEFWSWEQLQDALRSRQQRTLASGTESTLSTDEIRAAVRERCYDLRNKRRRALWTAGADLFGRDAWSADADDRRLFDTLLEAPVTIANDNDVAEVFESGKNQLAGAYQMGPFRRHLSGDGQWRGKLNDPENAYVDNLLRAIVPGHKPETILKLLETTDEVKAFVSLALNFPCQNGRRFRDDLGNLADIAAARKAVLLWLEHKVPTLLSREELRRPVGRFVQSCLSAGRKLLAVCEGTAASTGLQRLKELLRLSLAAASVDFNNPTLQKQFPCSDDWIVEYMRQRWEKGHLCAELGGDQFLKEFFDKYVLSRDASTIVYLPGNSAQAYISLAICQELLEQNLSLRVLFVPKCDAPGTDLTFEDAETILRSESRGLFENLAGAIQGARFALVPNGPTCHGLDPARLSHDTAEALIKATAIFAEGQAYAEIRGWRKPVYIAFRVNGRVAESIHGVSRARGAFGFVRLTPGVDHFEGFEASQSRRILDGVTNAAIRVSSQTTAEYVKAVLGENLPHIEKTVFVGDQREAYRQLNEEARRLGKTFAQILNGAASVPPDATSVRAHYENQQYPVFGCGGGGGFTSVTLKALRKLGHPVVAGVPSTDDGGSSGQVQAWFRKRGRFLFGVGDMAGILQEQLDNKGKQAVLAYRFDREPDDLVAALMERVGAELRNPTYAESPIGSAPDFLSFVCDQMNLARIIDREFRSDSVERLPVKGNSVRNLNVIAAYELCAPFGEPSSELYDERLGALYVLEKALGVSGIMVLPVTYDECALYLEYEDPVPPSLAKAFGVTPDALQEAGHRLIGQRFIDKLPQEGRRRTAGVIGSPSDTAKRPRCNPEYLARLRKAKLFIMGAGSLFSSQLAQLGVADVVDVLVSRQDIRRILVLNHVKLDETRGMTLLDHIRAIETVATASVSSTLLDRIAPVTKRLRISDLFTDIVVPRTVAREIEAEMAASQYVWHQAQEDPPCFVELSGAGDGPSIRVLRNRYVDFLLRHPEVQSRLCITLREIEVLSYEEQPSSLYGGRSEAGRYRGALFATDEDFQYLVDQGIQRRSIHELDSVGENWKVLKAEGAPKLEFFPGLVPEALIGIIRIALERGLGSPDATK